MTHTHTYDAYTHTYVTRMTHTHTYDPRMTPCDAHALLEDVGVDLSPSHHT